MGVQLPLMERESGALLDDESDCSSVSTADTRRLCHQAEKRQPRSYLQELALVHHQRDKPTLEHFVTDILLKNVPGGAQQLIQHPKLEEFLETLETLMRPVSTRGPTNNGDANEIITEVCDWWRQRSHLTMDDVLSEFLADFAKKIPVTDVELSSCQVDKFEH